MNRKFEEIKDAIGFPWSVESGHAAWKTGQQAIDAVTGSQVLVQLRR